MAAVLSVFLSLFSSLSSQPGTVSNPGTENAPTTVGIYSGVM
jgi:hypothetical protein